jgi:intraflagellar transport protein 88
VLARIAQLFSKQDDEVQAYHYQLESYRVWPVDINVITWLGIYYVKQELYEQAIPYFARAAEVQPLEAKWKLMVASCHRRLGSFQQALMLYERIHMEHPHDQECLRYLVQICHDMNLPSERYQTALRKLERLAEARADQMRQEEAGMGGPMMDDDGLMMGGPGGYYGDFGAQQGGYGGFVDMGGGPLVEDVTPGLMSGADDGLPVPAAKPKKKLAKPKPVEEDEDDDWGADDVGGLLA